METTASGRHARQAASVSALDGTPHTTARRRRTGTPKPATTVAPTVLRDLAFVALGGALGALARFGLQTMLPRMAFPWATVTANLLGSLILGFAFLDHGMEHGPRLFFAVGVLGAFTTLSTFSVETIELLQERRTAMAAGNMALNGLGGPLMALLGWRLRLLF